MLNLPEQGYTPANYAKLVELTGISNVAFCELFNIPKGTFEKHKAGTRTMKWQNWQSLLETVEQHLTTEQYKMKTLYEIYEAAHDEADSHSELTSEYLTDYADGAFDISLSEEKAQMIVDCIAAYEKADAARSYSTSQDLWICIEEPLSRVYA